MISIHSTARVETKIPGIGADFIPFQSTPPRGWRLAGSPTDLFPLKISIHSTARVETGSGGNGYRFTKISIHSTARVETDGLVQGQKAGTDFNPLHREGGDASRALLTGHHLRISIHSTARVETTRLMIQVRCQSPFQSTPPRGWRLNVAYAIYSSLGFQSTPPRGWRQRCEILHQYLSLDFNPLHREGGDVCVGTFPFDVGISIHSTARVETI